MGLDISIKGLEREDTYHGRYTKNIQCIYCS